jgi:hypothetical protein
MSCATMSALIFSASIAREVMPDWALAGQVWVSRLLATPAAAGPSAMTSGEVIVAFGSALATLPAVLKAAMSFSYCWP